ncbi:serine/threonine-protein phosphatase [Dactylosporangium roseum]|uniref:Serine/threonine-protein phosphatase n=1 Tax=Dactylosporangium roseum TaxID=47989 RepID=A0ABY5Z5S9_9ACTN|nr:PP2C family protein-serine/threonine phosphatase [Dactylosporangium roseum]UWZ37405.1 serine/threonine-protein phosphatase [Dactylosporangium roseum]
MALAVHDLALQGDINGVRVAVRCEVADRTANVGGDWYLSMALPDGDVLLAVGDVMGHGRAAAATMVQLRAVMTRLSLAGDEPGAVLAALNRMLCRRHTTVLATAVCGRFRPADRTLTWARAGHLPILRATSEGVSPLFQPPGMALGVDPAARYSQATVRLAGGEMLFMYTDGVVEQRDRAIDQGVQDLADDVRLAMRTAAPGERLRNAIDQARRGNPDDDACLLAAEPV